MAQYSGLFNTSAVIADIAELTDTTINSSLDLSTASVTGFPVDNVTCQFIDDGSGRKVLAVNTEGINTGNIKDGAVTTPKLAPQDYIPFKDLTAPEGITKAYINPIGLAATEFITQDSTSDQEIKSNITFQKNATFNNPVYLSQLTGPSILSLNSSKQIQSSTLPINSSLYTNSSGTILGRTIGDFQVLSGNGGVPTAKTLTSVNPSTRIQVGANASVLSLNLPQDIGLASDVTFNSIKTNAGTAGNSGPGMAHHKLCTTTGITQWHICLQSEDSDLAFNSFDDAGNFKDFAFVMRRNTGETYIKKLILENTSNQLSFGKIIHPTSWITTFDVQTNSLGNNTLTFPDAGTTGDIVAYLNKSQILANKQIGIGRIPSYPLDVSGNAYFRNNMQILGLTETVDIINSGGITTGSLYATTSEFSTTKTNDLTVYGNAYATGNIAASGAGNFVGNVVIGFPTSGSLSIGSSNIINVSGGVGVAGPVTFSNPASINLNGTMCHVSNTGNINPTNNYSGALYVWGSANSNLADVLHVREKVSTNPKEIFMGYNTVANDVNTTNGRGYGVIQSAYHNVGYTDTFISPNGGNVRIGGGLYLPNAIGGVNFPQSLFNHYEVFTFNAVFNCRGNTSSNFACKIVRTGDEVTMWIPSFSVIIGAGATMPNTMYCTSNIPERFRPSAAGFNIVATTRVSNVSTNFGPVYAINTGQIQICADAALTNFMTGMTSNVTGVYCKWVI